MKESPPEEKSEEENKQNIQESFLNTSEDQAETYKEEEPEASERLALMTREFMFSEKAGEAVDTVVEEKITVKLEELMPPLLEDHLEMLEILSMLFPGRAWDYSLQAFTGNISKISRNMHLFSEKALTCIRSLNRWAESSLSMGQKN